MKRFTPSELTDFLRAVDRHAKRNVSVVVIGGGAAVLGYGAETATKDLDAHTDISDLSPAIAAARRTTGLDVPLEHVTVGDLPYHFEERLVRVMPELQRLELWVPEIHDLVLSKLVRANAGDLATIAELHKRVSLSFDTLIERWRDEMDHAIGDPKRLRTNVLVGIRLLFGELAAVRAERAL